MAFTARFRVVLKLRAYNKAHNMVVMLYIKHMHQSCCLSFFSLPVLSLQLQVCVLPAARAAVIFLLVYYNLCNIVRTHVRIDIKVCVISRGCQKQVSGVASVFWAVSNDGR